MFNSLKLSISNQRLEAYRKDGCDDLETVARCLWNTSISEAFYPSLQYLEVGLRNSIDRAASLRFRDSYWFKRNFLCGRCREDVNNAEKYLEGQGKDSSDSGALISELKFGFWTRLFSRNYESSLWNNTVFTRAAFPYMNRRIWGRGRLSERFHKIRLFRNRIFHHEQILKYNLRSHHTKILETIGWIDPTLLNASRVIDRFDVVVSDDYYTKLKNKLSDYGEAVSKKSK